MAAGYRCHRFDVAARSLSKKGFRVKIRGSASITSHDSKGRIDITSAPVKKLDRLIVENNRLSPLLDTCCKLTPIVLAPAVVFTPILWAFFGAFLGQIGQRPLPIEQAGQWLFLLLFSAAAAFAVAALVLTPAGLALLLRLADPSADRDRTRRADHYVAGTTTLGTVLTIGIATLTNDADSWMPLAIMVILLVAGCTGGIIRLAPADRTCKAIFPHALLDAGKALVFALWLVSLWQLFAFTLSAQDGFVLVANLIVALSGTVLLLMASITRPWIGIVMGIALTGFWTVHQANPDEGFLIAKALYTANLGGGRPARIPQDYVAGEICDLGVEGRSVLVYEPEGCEWSIVQKRFKRLHGLDSLQRKRILGKWKKEAACARRPSGAGCGAEDADT